MKARHSVSTVRRRKRPVPTFLRSSSLSSNLCNASLMRLRHRQHVTAMYFLRYSMVQKLRKTAGRERNRRIRMYGKGWTMSVMRFFNGTSPSNHLELGVATPLPPTFITQVWKWITSQRAWDIQLVNMPSHISILIHIHWRNRWNTTPNYWI